MFIIKLNNSKSFKSLIVFIFSFNFLKYCFQLYITFTSFILATFILFDDDALFWLNMLILITIIIIVDALKKIQLNFKRLMLFIHYSVTFNNYWYNLKKELILILKIIIYLFPYFIFIFLCISIDLFHNIVLNECGGIPNSSSNDDIWCNNLSPDNSPSSGQVKLINIFLNDNSIQIKALEFENDVKQVGKEVFSLKSHLPNNADNNIPEYGQNDLFEKHNELEQPFIDSMKNKNKKN